MLFKNTISWNDIYPIAILVTVIVAGVLCSCSDESVTGAFRENAGKINKIPYTEVGRTEWNRATPHVYVFALDNEYVTEAIRVYDSLGALDFALSIHQFELLEADGIVEITRQDIISDVVRVSFGSESMSDRDMISAIGIISTRINVTEIPWTCLKLCADSDDYAGCIARCAGKKKDNGLSINVIF